MSSKTEICNMAISHLGSGKEIANIDTEQSQEAAACRRFYNISYQAMLTEHDWNFATEFYTLELIETQPTDEWAYSYRYPSDCLKIRRILSGTRNETLDSKVPYKIIKDTVGKLVYTDSDAAEVEITKDISDPSFYPAQFQLALSFRLASYIAARVTGGDPFKMKEDMLAQYVIEMGKALAQDMNSARLDKKPDSEFIRVRDGYNIGVQGEDASDTYHPSAFTIS